MGWLRFPLIYEHESSVAQLLSYGSTLAETAGFEEEVKTQDIFQGFLFLFLSESLPFAGSEVLAAVAGLIFNRGSTVSR